MFVGSSIRSRLGHGMRSCKARQAHSDRRRTGVGTPPLSHTINCRGSSGRSACRMTSDKIRFALTAAAIWPVHSIAHAAHRFGDLPGPSCELSSCGTCPVQFSSIVTIHHNKHPPLLIHALQTHLFRYPVAFPQPHSYLAEPLFLRARFSRSNDNLIVAATSLPSR